MLLFQVADKNSWENGQCPKTGATHYLAEFLLPNKGRGIKEWISVGNIIHNVTKLNLGYNKITASGV